MNVALATSTPTEDSLIATATPQSSRGLLTFARFLSFIQRSPDMAEATDLRMPSYGTDTTSSKPPKSTKHVTKTVTAILSADDGALDDDNDPLTTTPKHKSASKKKKTMTQNASIEDVSTSAGYALPSEMSFTSASRSSRITQANDIEHTASMTTAESSPVRVTTKMWHPVKNNAKRIGVPKLLLGLLSLRASIVGAHIVPRADSSPSVTSTPTPTTLSSSMIQPISMYNQPLAKAAALTCPEGQSRCGDNICFDPKVQWCCPDEAIACSPGQQCAFGELDDGAKVYTCAPADATNGTDPRIYTGSMAIVKPTATGNATFPKPTGNGSARFGVPGVFRHIALLGKVVRAVAFPSRGLGECCSGICCEPGESCARSSEGPKCWPAERFKVGEAEIVDEDVHTSAVAPVHSNTRKEASSMNETDIEKLEQKKGGGGHGGGGHGGGGRGGSVHPGGGSPGGSHKSDAGERLTFMALHILGAAGLAFVVHRWF